MPIITKKMPSFQAVAAGQTAIANLPIGLTYEELLIRYKSSGTDANAATAKADLSEIRLMVDGDAKWTVSATELLALNGWYGRGYTDGVVQMHLSNPEARTVNGEDAAAYGTADVQTMALEIDIAAGATAPSLELYAKLAPQSPLGQHLTVRRFAYNASATGIREIADLPRGPFALLAMHAASGNVADVEVEANQRLIYDADVAIAEALAAERGKAFQSGYFHIDFVPKSRLSDALPLMLQDFRVRFNLTGTGAFNILAERIEGRAA